MSTTTTKRRTSARSRVQNPLETYLKEINETALLTADEEKMLSRKISAGDGAARDGRGLRPVRHRQLGPPRRVAAVGSAWAWLPRRRTGGGTGSCGEA